MDMWAGFRELRILRRIQGNHGYMSRIQGTKDAEQDAGNHGYMSSIQGTKDT